KSEIKMSLISLYYTFLHFFLMHKVKVGEETVKFLANFDHLTMAALVHPLSRRRHLSLSPSDGERVGVRGHSPAPSVQFAVGVLIYSSPFPPQNFLAPLYDCAIVPRILGNWILNEMDNHGT